MSVIDTTLDVMRGVDDFVDEVKVCLIMGPWWYAEDKLEIAKRHQKEKKATKAAGKKSTVSDNQTPVEKGVNKVMESVFPKHEADDIEIKVDVKASSKPDDTATTEADANEATVEVMDIEANVIKNSNSSKKHGHDKHHDHQEEKKEVEEETKEVSESTSEETVDEVPFEEDKAEKPAEPPAEEQKEGTVIPPMAEIIKDEDKVVTKPLNFVKDKSQWLDMSPASELEEYQKNTFEKLFTPYLKDVKYAVHPGQGGAINLDILDNDDVAIRQIIIDPGIAIGDGWNILGTFRTSEGTFDTIPVSLYDKDIVGRIFKNPAYLLSKKEVKRCSDRMFKDQGIYSFVDMSNMHNELKKLTADDIYKLGQKLTYIIQHLTEEEAGRFRFDKFRSVDNFRLVSDESCKCPFPGSMRTNFTGAKVIVRGDDITVQYNDQQEKYTIIDYSVL